MDSPKADGAETKAQFRKLSNDATNRKYRRHSPVNGSSASDESPKHERGDAVDFSEHRKEDKRELERETEKNYYGKGRDSYRNSDARSSRDSHRHSKHEDYSRREKYVDKEEKRYQESSHSSRNTHSERTRDKNDHGRSKEHARDDDRFSRERYESSGHRSRDKDREPRDKDKDRHRHDKSSWDEKRDYHRSPRLQKSERTHYHDDTRSYRNEYRGKDSDGHRIREFDDDAAKEANARQERKKQSGWDTNCSKDSKDQDEENFVLGSENQISPAKKPKLLDLEKADEKQSSQIANESSAAGDLNAATVAAMKAAELVNRNLVGTGFMSTEQKKKLLWGNKKSTTAEQSGTQWNASLFGDRERQEKFNKLMGVKGDTKGEHAPENPVGGHLQAEKQKELQMDLEKQYTAGLRRRDGRTVGLGL